MKLLLSVLAALLLLTGIAVYVVLSNKEQVPPPTEQPVDLPIAEDENNAASQPLPNQNTRQGNNESIVSEFRTQAHDYEELKFAGTAIYENYALQVWHDEYTGGESLFKYTDQTGWKLVPGGGGAWNVAELVAQGVPERVAKQLVLGKQ